MVNLILKKSECSGCHACANICDENCITMQADAEGFLYPNIDHDRCSKCGNCIRVCSERNITPLKDIPIAIGCINKNESVRSESSSGGIFSLIADKVLDEQGVIFGAQFNENFEVVHSYIKSKEDLGKFRGSKYIQSKINMTYRSVKEFLNSNRLVLFSGTPCQVAGLLSFLGQPHDTLLCIDIICHGVPSLKVWKKYLNYQQNIAASSVKNISFRSKEQGWKKYSMVLEFQSGRKHSKSFDQDLFMKAFLNNISLRPSCYACAFKSLHRQSDITLADFWGVQRIIPEMDDDGGASLILINSIKGQNMFELIKHDMVHQVVNIDQAIEHNTAAIKSVSVHSNREIFFKELENLRFDQLVNNCCVEWPIINRKRSIKSSIKSIFDKMAKSMKES